MTQHKQPVNSPKAPVENDKSKDKQDLPGKNRPDRQETSGKAPGGLSKEDLPDSTNESTGSVGSGLRQDSN
jgi:hypothetical protein